MAVATVRSESLGPRRPRVLVVGQGPPATGGIPTYLGSILSSRALRERFSLSFLNTSTVRDKRPGGLTAANLKAAAAHARAIRRTARAADVVHLNLAPVPLLPLLRAGALAAAARRAGAAVVLHAHTGRLPAALRRPGYRAAFRAVSRIVDRLVVVSAEAELAARRLGVAATRLAGGVDASRFASGPKAQPPSLVFVGTVCERKGLIDLRDALTRLPRRPVVRVVGDAAQEGPGVFERVVEAYESAGLGAVDFTGALPAEEVARLLAEASVFCLPSHWEGTPLSLLEAMAAGAAPVATAVGDIPEVLAGGAGVVVAPRRPDLLAAAIERLLDDPEERARVGAAARRRVEERYGPAAVERSVGALYDELAPVARSRRGAG